MIGHERGRTKRIHPPLSFAADRMRQIESAWGGLDRDNTLGDALRITSMGQYRSDSSPQPWIRQKSRVLDVTLTSLLTYAVDITALQQQQQPTRRRASTPPGNTLSFASPSVQTMTFCGYKLSLCLVVISVWGIVQLLVMAGLLYFEAGAFFEDLHLESSYDSKENFITDVAKGFKNCSFNCFIAACLYIVTLGVSGWQFYLNQKTTNHDVQAQGMMVTDRL
ncbi:Ribonuclease kappa [Chionoecetes opilio]|uniref:Ribonuclease kappa n=1 Tax=Chionoecetes opilio TaxID=41210 RepID=A0A8J5D2C1_CHIOP|nr:Ribonuclease kappa [Chionoecetes opilio]